MRPGKLAIALAITLRGMDWDLIDIRDTLDMFTKGVEYNQGKARGMTINWLCRNIKFT